MLLIFHNHNAITSLPTFPKDKSFGVLSGESVEMSERCKLHNVSFLPIFNRRNTEILLHFNWEEGEKRERTFF